MSFSKSWNCTPRSGSCNFSFLKNSLVQINSKLNSKPYDYLYLLTFTFHIDSVAGNFSSVIPCLHLDIYLFIPFQQRQRTLFTRCWTRLQAIVQLWNKLCSIHGSPWQTKLLSSLVKHICYLANELSWKIINIILIT